jgi:hypothetical protein
MGRTKQIKTPSPRKVSPRKVVIAETKTSKAMEAKRKRIAEGMLLQRKMMKEDPVLAAGTLAELVHKDLSKTRGRLNSITVGLLRRLLYIEFTNQVTLPEYATLALVWKQNELNGLYPNGDAPQLYGAGERGSKWNDELVQDIVADRYADSM